MTALVALLALTRGRWKAHRGGCLEETSARYRPGMGGPTDAMVEDARGPRTTPRAEGAGGHLRTGEKDGVVHVIRMPYDTVEECESDGRRGLVREVGNAATHRCHVRCGRAKPAYNISAAAKGNPPR